MNSWFHYVLNVEQHLNNRKCFDSNTGASDEDEFWNHSRLYHIKYLDFLCFLKARGMNVSE